MLRPISEYVGHSAFAPGSVDDEGNPVGESWGAPVQTGVFAFDPGSSSEPRLPGHERVVVEPTVYYPAEVVFGSRDRVVARGVAYEVEGEPHLWVHPTDPGRRANVVTLRRVDG